MREILFRGKTKEGEWVEGWFVGKTRKAPYALPLDKPQIIDKNLLCYNVEPDTVGQYTGLEDRNGKKIFEGDIVKHYHDRKFPKSYSKGVIFYSEEYLRWKRTSENVNCCIANDCIYEVIGNIHDNPELIGGK